MPEMAQWQLACRGMQVSEGKPKAKKIRRRRTTGRVGGTTQSAFASQSMSSVLQQQAKDQASKKEKASAEDQADEEPAAGKQDDAEAGS